MAIQLYVVGFVFSHDLSEVLLIKKNRPDWQRGKYNGIGGKVEWGEGLREAMAREFSEEVKGAVVPKDAWVYFVELRDATEEKFLVDFFYTVCSKEQSLREFLPATDELLNIFSIADIFERYDRALIADYQWRISMIIPNLRYLIPMAINHYQELETAKSFIIREVME